MKRPLKLITILALTILISSCVKEGYVCYRFQVYNLTDTSLKIHLSSWGSYQMYINDMYDSRYKFHDVETIQPNLSLIFSTEVGDEPDPLKIPPSLIPAWEYITAIECNGVSIPKEYFTNPKNWELNTAMQINGTFTHITLYISPELIEQLRQN